MKNKAFWRAIDGLAQPFSLGMILLLLFNDYVLRWRWPSWWTGKIGDFAWLAFAPLALAALLAWLIPSGRRDQEAIVGRLAFGLTGGIFALAKTLPIFYALVSRLLAVIAGGAVGLRRDPTDLITLPALLVGWQVWQRSRPRAPGPRVRGWLALSLATLATVASTPPTVDYGITCLVEREGTLFAANTFSHKGETTSCRYYSQDGGLSWWENTAFPDVECNGDEDAGQALLQARAIPGSGIEISQDGGQTWQHEVSFSWGQARAAYYETQIASQQAEFRPGPLDVLVHRPTGQVVAAMGLEGVLVRTADAQWHWVAVGPYHRPDLEDLASVQPLITDELWLALALGLLTLGTLAQRTDEAERLSLVLVPGTLWGIAVLLRVIYYASLGSGWMPMVSFVATLSWQMSVFVCGIWGLYGLLHAAPRPLLFGGLAALGGVVAFLTPYFLWSRETIDQYATASTYAALAAIAVLGGGLLYRFSVLGLRPAPSRARRAAKPRGQRVTWSGWAVASGLGVAVGQVVAFSLMRQQIRWTWSEIDLFGLSNPVLAGVVLGSAVGVMQWLALRRQVDRAGWWVPVTLVGIAWGVIVASWLRSRVPVTSLIRAGLWSGGVRSVVTILRNKVVVTALLGGSVGATQWVVLRRWVDRAGWWVLANAIGWPVGFLAGDLLIHLPFETFFAGMALLLLALGLDGERVLAAGLTGAGVGISVGVITGGLLTRLLRRYVPPSPVAPDEPVTPVPDAPPASTGPQADVSPVSPAVEQAFLGYLRDQSRPVEDRDVAAEIQEILQRRRQHAPDLQARDVRVKSAPDGSVQIIVDGEVYDEIAQVPDPGVREVLQAAVKEWEARGGASGEW